MYHYCSCKGQNRYLVLVEELVKLFWSNCWQNPQVTLAVHYFPHNSDHHYYKHFHSYCKMHIYHLKILLTISLGFQLNFFSFSPGLNFSLVLFQLFFFMPFKKKRNSFTTIRQFSMYSLYLYLYP